MPADDSMVTAWCDRPLDTRDARFLVLAALQKVRGRASYARRLVAQTAGAQTLAVRKPHAPRLSARRSHAQTLAVRKPHAGRPGAQRGRPQTPAVRKGRARRLGMRRRLAQALAVRNGHARQLGAGRGLAPLWAVGKGAQQGLAQPLAVRKERARRLGALRHLARPLAVRKNPAQALAALCLVAPLRAPRVKPLAGSGAIATFGQSSNASWLVAPASHATALVVRSHCAMSRVPLMMLPANATPAGLSARGPPSLRETAPGTARRPESNFLPAATWTLRASEERTRALLRARIWASRSPALSAAGQGLAAPLSAALLARSASDPPRVLPPRSQPPQQASAAL